MSSAEIPGVTLADVVGRRGVGQESSMLSLGRLPRTVNAGVERADMWKIDSEA